MGESKKNKPARSREENPKMTRKIELLAPAGNMDSLQAAIYAGADAVYFGMGRMNARAAARNFDSENIQDALAHCQTAGVRTYLALNTLLLDKEMGEALQTAALLYEYGADALIVQDWGLLAELRKQLPGWTFHGSTQMSVLTLDGVQAAQRMGLSRIVLGRECSLVDMKDIAAQSDLELEVFVQGAMCVSVSGQCLHSSMLGARSGNRGACAQPCRMPYRMAGGPKEEAGYLLSMKDQCQLAQLPALIAQGVSSLKIEGRMKSAAYVGGVVSAYRRAIDDIYQQKSVDFASESQSLAAVFGRNGVVSQGYARGNDQLIDIRDPSYLRGAPAAVPALPSAARPRMDMRCRVRLGQAVELQVSLPGRGLAVTVTGQTVQQAQKAPLTAQRLREALGKLGDSPYALGDCDMELDTAAFLPVSALNALRRQALEALEAMILRVHRRPNMPTHPPDFIRKRKICPPRPKLLAQVVHPWQGEAALQGGADGLIVQPRDWRTGQALLHWQDWLEQKQRQGQTIPAALSLPPVLLPRGAAQVERLLLAHGQATLWAGAVAGNIGSVALLGRHFGRVYGDYTLNISNTAAALAMQAQGLAGMTLSVELNAAQMRDIASAVEGQGALVYGYLPTMQLAHCPVRRAAGACAACSQGMHMTDRKGQTLALHPFYLGAEGEPPHCMWQLFNALPLDLGRFGDKLAAVGLDSWQMLFLQESKEEIVRCVCAYRQLRDEGKTTPLPNATGGHFQKGWTVTELEPRQRGRA